MKQHGIHTTKAEYWIHLHPLDPPSGAVYWYRVTAMRWFIELTKPAVTIGFSKDPANTPTGAGLLVNKSEFFINSVALSARYCRGFDWAGATDRQRGLRGEQIAAALIDHGIIQLYRQITTSARTQEEQCDSVDGSVTWLKKTRFEVKTETYRSDNLFVQTHEGFHKPNFTVGGIEKLSSMLPLFRRGDHED
jgi:hypothetical protein